MELFIVTTDNWRSDYPLNSIVEMEPMPNPDFIRFGTKKPFTTVTGIQNFNFNTKKVTTYLVGDRLQKGDIDFFIDLAKHFNVGVLQIANYNDAKQRRQFGEITLEEYSIAKNKALRGLYEETKKLYK